MQKKGRRMLSLILSFMMMFSLIPSTVFAAEPEPVLADHLVISQAYGGGGNSGATYKQDFIELYNPTDTDIDLNGYIMKYGNAKPTDVSGLGQDFELSGTIKSKAYFLIEMAPGNGGTQDIPTPELKGEWKMGAKEFVIALMKHDEVNAEEDILVDLLGTGSAKV